MVVGNVLAKFKLHDQLKPGYAKIVAKWGRIESRTPPEWPNNTTQHNTNNNNNNNEGDCDGDCERGLMGDGDEYGDVAGSKYKRGGTFAWSALFHCLFPCLFVWLVGYLVVFVGAPHERGGQGRAEERRGQRETGDWLTD